LVGFNIGGYVPLCSAGHIGDFVIHRVMVCYDLFALRTTQWGTVIALLFPSDRGDVRMSMRQVELTGKLLTNRMRVCTSDEFFNLNCW